MLDIKITISCPDLIQAARILTKQSDPKPEAPIPAASAPAATTAPAVPKAPVSTAPASVPVTAAPSFTLEQVAKAGADYVAANPNQMPAVMALLQQFGIQSVQQLKTDQIGPFATALRGLGARI